MPRNNPTHLFARRHHLAKPTAMQLKGWETDTPPFGQARRGGRAAAASASSNRRLADSTAALPAESLIPELPPGVPSRGVYVTVPFATEPTPLREALWGLAAGTAELVAALQAPFAVFARRSFEDKLPAWGAATADPAGCVVLPPEQARLARVLAARAEEGAARRRADEERDKQKKKRRKGGEVEAAAPPPPPPPPPRRPRLNAGFPTPGMGVVIASNIAVVWAVLNANPPF